MDESRIKTSPIIWHYPCRHLYIEEYGRIKVQTLITKTVSKSRLPLLQELFKEIPQHPRIKEFYEELGIAGVTISKLNPFRVKDHINLMKYTEGFQSETELRLIQNSMQHILAQFNKSLDEEKAYRTPRPTKTNRM